MVDGATSNGGNIYWMKTESGDEAGNYVFNVVPTINWDSPDTLEHWQQAWAELCKFAEKGLDVCIDHRSYDRQGLDSLPIVHAGIAVWAMKKKGICTEKGEFKRWIKETNALIHNLKKKSAALLD